MIKQLTLLFLLFPILANADVLPLDDALRATYTACVGIDDSLADLKKMAGINTAVTAVGTGLGAGATVVGIIKTSVDKDLIKILSVVDNTNNQIKNPDSADVLNIYDKYIAQYGDIQTTTKQLRQQSKNLGKWRTGLMAGNTVTNVAGAIIAGNNKVDDDLQSQIDVCRAAIKGLRDSISASRIAGIDVTEATEIASACGEFEYVDVSKINKRAQGAMVSSVIGVTTGLAGTVTSAVANSDKVRNEGEYSKVREESDWTKEKNWNTAANVLAGASTVASGVATVFNATQISAIKKVANVASKCTEVLK